MDHMVCLAVLLLLCVWDVFSSTLSYVVSLLTNPSSYWEHFLGTLPVELLYQQAGAVLYFSGLVPGGPTQLCDLYPLMVAPLHSRDGNFYDDAVLLEWVREGEQAVGLYTSNQLPYEWLLGFPGCSMVSSILLAEAQGHPIGWLSRGAEGESMGIGGPYCFIRLKAWQGPSP